MYSCFWWCFWWLFCFVEPIGSKTTGKSRRVLFALMGHKSNYKIKTCFNRSCEKSKPTRNSPALTKKSKRFVRPVGSKNNRKIGAFFFTSRVTNLITKSKRFEIGRVKNLHHSDNIFIGFGGGPRLRKMGREALRPRISKCHKENV